MKSSNVLCLILALTISACGKNESTSHGDNPQNQTSGQLKELSQMPLADALITKYESAILNCNLWTRMKGPLFISNKPNDTVSIDLLKNSQFPKTVNLSAKVDIHSLSIQIKLTDIQLQNGGYEDSYGARYSFQNSPAIYGEYSGQTSTMYPDGYVGGPFTGNSFIINENIKGQIVAVSSHRANETAPTVDYVECTVITKSKPLYRDQWRQDSVGNEPSCLVGNPANSADCMIRRSL
ncbi:MAG: hypothetical protein ACXVCP_09600 [Bdellovibrio sp.]